MTRRAAPFPWRAARRVFPALIKAGEPEGYVLDAGLETAPRPYPDHVAVRPTNPASQLTYPKIGRVPIVGDTRPTVFKYTGADWNPAEILTII